MKQTKLWLTTIAVLLCSLTASAHDFEVDGIYYNINSTTDLTVAVTYRGSYYDSYSNEYSGAVTIPSTVTYDSKTYSVTSIGERAFFECSGLTAITITEYVSSIGSYAFNGCSSLKEVVIEDGTTTLSLGYNERSNSSTGTGRGLFYSCPLKKVYLGRNLSYISDKRYGYSPFYGKNGLTYVSIGCKVTSIGEYLFFSCLNLQSVTIGSGVSSIGNDAFPSASSSSRVAKVIWLTNTPPTGYSIVNGRINYVANDQYSSLSNVKIYPYLSSMFEVDGVKYVPVSTSERTCDAIDCTYDRTAKVINVNKTVSFRGIAMTVRGIMPYFFTGNNYIKKAVLSYKGCISDCAFYSCDSLDTVIMGDEITDLGNSTFAFCSSLPEITIPKTIVTIGDDAFFYCRSLTNVFISDRTEPLALGSDLFANCPLDSVYIGGKITYDTTSDGGYSPFYRNTSLRSVVITDREEQVYDNEFYGCTNLQNVTIGNGVSRIGDYAFSGCSSLAGFSFGSSMESIGTEAFSDCTNLTSITSHATVPPTCGTQALDDINKWNCSLRVPSGYAAAYQTADQWKEFFFIEDVVEVDTGIEKSEIRNEKSEIIYDLQGCRVENPIKGLYIINGKKVVIK